MEGIPCKKMDSRRLPNRGNRFQESCHSQNEQGAWLVYHPHSTPLPWEHPPLGK